MLLFSTYSLLRKVLFFLGNSLKEEIEVNHILLLLDFRHGQVVKHSSELGVEIIDESLDEF